MSNEAVADVHDTGKSLGAFEGRCEKEGEIEGAMDGNLERDGAALLIIFS